jgi:hypothetical protein
VNYDLAVWEGAKPTSDATALREFRRLYDDLFNAPVRVPASPAIESYVARLLDRFPDTPTSPDVDPHCAWVHRPLLGNASGPLIYFAVHARRAADVAAHAAELAAQAGLVVFDPQTGRLR